MNIKMNSECFKHVAVIGGGGHAKEVIATLQAVGHRVTAVYDDDAARQGAAVLGIDIAGSVEMFSKNAASHDGAVIAIGHNATRRKLSQNVPMRWLSAVHPTAWVHVTASLGEGTVVFAGAVVQPDCVVGSHAIINTAATLSHDCVLEDFSHVAPGSHLTGGVRVREGAFIGAGSTLLPSIEVGAWTTVGAGSVVTRPLPANVIAFGAPAKVQRSLSLSP